VIPGYWRRLSDGEHCWVEQARRGYIVVARYYFRDGGTMGYFPLYEDLMWTHEPERWS
jgi:hypothetical protein